MCKVERREFAIRDLVIEERGNGGDGPRIEGYAAVFNQTADLGYYREMIEPGAFADSIREDDVRALWNHDPNFVLGRNTSGTLKLAEDEHGLRVVIRPPEAQWARDLIESMKRGDVDQMSFAFETLADEWKKNEGVNLRVLQKVKLYDVSVVTYPAYEQTIAHARDVFAAYQAAADSIQEDGDVVGAASEDGSPDEPVSSDEGAQERIRYELERKRLEILLKDK